MTSRAAKTGVCPSDGCELLAFRVPDDLSYATAHFTWVCPVGHETTVAPTADERPRFAA